MDNKRLPRRARPQLGAAQTGASRPRAEQNRLPSTRHDTRPASGPTDNTGRAGTALLDAISQRIASAPLLDWGYDAERRANSRNLGSHPAAEWRAHPPDEARHWANCATACG